jgi:HlyD family secretion protein
MPRLPRSAILAVTAVSLAVLALIIWRLRAPGVRVARVRRGSLEQHIVVSGRVRVPTRVQVSSRSPGLVVAVLANEGRRVSAGDLLVQLDDAEAQAALAQARAGMHQARARVDQLRRVGRVTAMETLRQAETNVDETQAAFERAQRLAAQGATPALELDNARRALDRARAQRASAMAQQVASAPMGTDSRIALTALLEAQARAAGAEARLDQTHIAAPGNGVVLSRSVEAGDVVQPGQTLIVLAVDADPELVFDADERNIPFIAIGQRASASADAYPQELFESRVSFVAPSVDPQRGTVEVRLAVRKPAPAFLKPDMTVSVDLTVASKTQALLVPTEAVQGAATRSPWAMVVDSGRARRRAVALGIRGEGATEIAAGISEGAEVVLSDGRALVDGQRVRPTVVEP